VLGRAAANAFFLSASATVIVLGRCFFDPSLVEIVADLFALKTDEVEAVYALVDLFTVEDSTLEFFDADPE